MSRTESFARRSPSRRALSLAASVAMAIAATTTLVACGGGDDPAPQAAQGTQIALTGTAATGAAIAGATVTATNAAGQQVTTLTAADGSYSLSITEGAPYLLSITDGAGKEWFSYAAEAGVANITPLTTLALLNANGNAPLSALASSWANAQISTDAVLEAAARVNANLASVMSAQGLDPSSFNPFNTAFTVGQAGYDTVLDAMRVSFNCSASSCTQSIQSPSGSMLVEWNANISTAGYSVSWTDGSGEGGTVTVGLGACAAPQAGTYSLVVRTTVAGAATPEVCIDGLPGKPANQSEFCGASDVTGALPAGVTINSCSFSGDTGTINATITTPVTLSYSIEYRYVLNP